MVVITFPQLNSLSGMTVGVPPLQISDVNLLQDSLLKAQHKWEVQYDWKPRSVKQPRWFNVYKFIRWSKRSSHISFWLQGLKLHPEGIHLAARKLARLR
jgi:hypothetical protein